MGDNPTEGDEHRADRHREAPDGLHQQERERGGAAEQGWKTDSSLRHTENRIKVRGHNDLTVI